MAGAMHVWRMYISCRSYSKIVYVLQVNMMTEVTFLKDVLRGDEHYEIRLKLLNQSPENYPFKDDD
jgi:hypothetical protein